MYLNQIIKKGIKNDAVLQVKLMNIFWELSLQKSLKPSSKVNNLFKQLVDIVCNDHCDSDQDREVAGEWVSLIEPVFNSFCAKGEELLEKHWCKKFLQTEQLNWEKLAEFIYFQNYKFLAEWEFALMKEYSKKTPAKLLFVGSGALPLSAMLMAHFYDVEIDCLDNDTEAVSVSRELIGKMGLQDRVRVHEGNFFEQRDLDKYDFVIIAALVGTNELQKQLVLDHLKNHLASNQTFLIRTVDKLRTLFYQQVKLEWLDGFNDVRIFHPKGEIINSVILAKN